MTVLEQAVSHFDNQEVDVIEVPEWADEKGSPAVIYSKPFTLNEKKKLYKFAKDDDLEFVVRVVIMKSLDKDGSPMFDLSDKISLLNKVDPDVLTRLAGKLGTADSVEDSVEN